jgi:hypothetical protein
MPVFGLLLLLLLRLAAAATHTHTHTHTHTPVDDSRIAVWMCIMARARVCVCVARFSLPFRYDLYEEDFHLTAMPLLTSEVRGTKLLGEFAKRLLSSEWRPLLSDD